MKSVATVEAIEPPPRYVRYESATYRLLAAFAEAGADGLTDLEAQWTAGSGFKGAFLAAARRVGWLSLTGERRALLSQRRHSVVSAITPKGLAVIEEAKRRAALSKRK